MFDASIKKPLTPEGQIPQMVSAGESLRIQDIMEVNCKNYDSNGKRPSDKQKKPSVDNSNTSAFVNHAAITWNESRREWIGNVSQRSEGTTKDPIIDWSTAYEDLLSTHEPFPQPIPLPEMVDFLVDIWHDEGLFD